MERATAQLEGFSAHYAREWTAVMRAKLGLAREEEGDAELAGALLDAMHAGQADFTLVFRRLAGCAASTEGEAALLELFREPSAMLDWLPRWRERLGREERERAVVAAAMRAANPLYIPRNHLVEQTIEAALEGDYRPFEALREVLARPYRAQPGRERYAQPARPHERVLRTFCGT